MVAVRVVPDVIGLDKEFDYEVPENLIGDVGVGDLVRVDLHGRRVRAWVVRVDPPDARSNGVKPIVLRSGCGPDESLIDLAGWAAVRWAGRRRTFLAAASPTRRVGRRPAARRSSGPVDPRSPASSAALADGGGVLRLPPSSDPMPAVASAIAHGPVIVILPSADAAALLASRVRRAGRTVAVMPNDWAAAAGGVDVVVGTRTAAWAPCPDLAAAVVVDEHDESLQEASSPTWHARDVMIERCRRAGVPLLLVSPCPSATALQWGRLSVPPRSLEQRAWPLVEVVDRSDVEPWKKSLITTELITELRHHDRTVVCVTNTVGRARLMACRRCRSLVRCEPCGSSVVVDDDDSIVVCPVCDTARPPVCLECGSGAFANLRPGVSRLREEIEAAAGRQVVAVTAASSDVIDRAGVYVGTEAVLHRVDRADTVAFVDFDRELLAPRYRAGEQAMALLVRAARLVGPRSGGGKILVQTFVPGHDVIRAARSADPGIASDVDVERRRTLGLPPFGALAEIAGHGSDEYVASLPLSDSVTVVGRDERYAARADEWMELGRVLSAGRRPPGSRLRVAVDPAR